LKHCEALLVVPQPLAAFRRRSQDALVEPLLDALDTKVHGAWFDSIGIVLFSISRRLSSLISAAHLNSAQP
jgi:hypothetical protein